MANTSIQTGGGRISETARSAAIFRAAHMLLDSSPHVFEDPFARALSGFDDDQSLVEAFLQRPAHVQRGRGLFAVRSRFTEDALAQAVARGVQHYVVLGAGLDSFGLRSSVQMGLAGVFEVDLPEAQEWKRSRMKGLNLKVPAPVHYVPCDLSSGPLWRLLLEAGLDDGVPVFFSCLGVTQYLSTDSLHRLLDQVASAPSGSELVLQYQEPINDAAEGERSMLRYFAEASAKLGEPWLSFLTTAAIRSLLEERGFTEVDHLDGADARNRYLAGRNDEVTVPEYLHILHARC